MFDVTQLVDTSGVRSLDLWLCCLLGTSPHTWAYNECSPLCPKKSVSQSSLPQGDCSPLGTVPVMFLPAQGVSTETWLLLLLPWPTLAQGGWDGAVHRCWHSGAAEGQRGAGLTGHCISKPRQSLPAGCPWVEQVEIYII